MRMCKTISFNSWNNYFKAPFGALKVNEGADIKVIINDESVYSINLIIEKEDDALKALEKLEKTEIKKLLVISQTTYSLEKFYIIREIIENELPRNIELVIKNTICATTEQRQIETKELSKKVDMMIIIGGKNSSNTKKLYEVAQENCKKSVCIEDYKELEKLQNEIKKEEKIGIMAGASTPQKSIEEVEKYLNGL